MFEWISLHVLALIGVALQFGGMAYFAFMFTPMVFKFVDREDAAIFLRQVFPVYYRINAVIAIIPALLLIPGHSYEIEVGTMLVVAAAFLFAARVIVPMANKAREDSVSQRQPAGTAPNGSDGGALERQLHRNS